MKFIIDILDYISLLSLLIAVFSHFQIIDYLYKKGIVSSHIGGNPFVILKYVELTKKDKKHKM
jgi:hypothetical protein